MVEQPVIIQGRLEMTHHSVSYVLLKVDHLEVGALRIPLVLAALVASHLAVLAISKSMVCRVKVASLRQLQLLMESPVLEVTVLGEVAQRVLMQRLAPSQVSLVQLAAVELLVERAKARLQLLLEQPVVMAVYL